MSRLAKLLVLIAFLALLAAGAEACGVINESITLSNDVYNESSCFLVNVSNIIIDCNGKSITGNNTGVGINVSNFNNVTITDCTIDGFAYGVLVPKQAGSSEITIVDSSIDTLKISDDTGVNIMGSSIENVVVDVSTDEEFGFENNFTNNLLNIGESLIDVKTTINSYNFGKLLGDKVYVNYGDDEYSGYSYFQSLFMGEIDNATVSWIRDHDYDSDDSNPNLLLYGPKSAGVGALKGYFMRYYLGFYDRPRSDHFNDTSCGSAYELCDFEGTAIEVLGVVYHVTKAEYNDSRLYWEMTNGTHTINLTDDNISDSYGSNVMIDGVEVDDLYVDWSIEPGIDEVNLSSLTLTWLPSDEIFIGENESVSFPGLGSFSVNFYGMYKNGTDESIIIEPDGDQNIRLSAPLAAGTTSVNILYFNQTSSEGVYETFGEYASVASRGRIFVQSGTVYEGDYILMTNFSKRETHIVELDRISSLNITTLKDLADNQEYSGNCTEFCNISVGNLTVFFDSVDSTSGYGVLNAASEIGYEIFTAQGLTINLSSSPSLGTEHNITIIEEDENGTLANGNRFIITCGITDGYDTTVANVTEVEDVFETAANDQSTKAWEYGDTDVWGYMSFFGTNVKHDKSGTEYSINITYPGAEAHANVTLETRTYDNVVLNFTSLSVISNSITNYAKSHLSVFGLVDFFTNNSFYGGKIVRYYPTHIYNNSGEGYPNAVVNIISHNATVWSGITNGSGYIEPNITYSYANLNSSYNVTWNSTVLGTISLYDDTPLDFYVDLVPPVILSSSPSGTVNSHDTYMSVVTDEYAYCRYSTVYGLEYSAMNLTFTDSGTTNTVFLQGLSNGDKRYYVKCVDRSGQVSDEYQIYFTISGYFYSGRGGGGGIPREPEPQVSQVWQTILPETTYTMKVDDDAFCIKELAFSSTTSLHNVEVSVEISKDNALRLFKGVVYQAFEIEHENMDKDDLQEFELSFKINKSWFIKNGLDSSTVRLYRYNDFAWLQLNTDKVYSDNQYVHYKATGNAMSLFAVAADQPTSPTVTYQDEDYEPLFDDDTAGSATGAAHQMDGLVAIEEPEPIEQEENSFSFFVIFLLFIMVLIIGIVGAIAYKRMSHEKTIGMLESYIAEQKEADNKAISSEKVYPELAEYIRTNLEAGIGRSKLKESLIAAGWPEEVVDYHLVRFSL